MPDQPTRKQRPDLYECELCGPKSGSPSLCDRCLKARAVAGDAWVGPWYSDPDRSEGQVNPTDPKHHGTPLWVLYGHECAPSIMCCLLIASDHPSSPGVTIWGYSVYHGVPGFRTLGLRLSEWAERSSYGPLFFAAQEPALDELRRVTTPVL